MPNGLQLALRRFQLDWEFGLHHGPHRVVAQLVGLALPLRHVPLHTRQSGLCFCDGFGRQHLNALGQQDSGFPLHHDLVLQIFHAFDDFRQTGLQPRQGLAGQWRAGFCGIALPGHGICDVQVGRLQNVFGLLCPIGGQRLLTVHPLELVAFFFQQLGRAFVAGGHFTVHLGQIRFGGLGQKPFTQAGATLSRGHGLKCPAGQSVKSGKVEGLIG